MVENNENFGLHHTSSYEEGTFHKRYFYPRVVCCRLGGRGLMEGEASPAQSPANSPQHRPLLAHVRGSSVVSKIARPQTSSPTSRPPLIHTKTRTADLPSIPPGFPVPQVGPEGSSVDPPENYPDPGGSPISPDISSPNSEIVVNQPGTSQGRENPFNIAKNECEIHKGATSLSSPGEGQGRTDTGEEAEIEEKQGFMCDAAPLGDGTVPPDSPGTSSSEGSSPRAVFRLSDASNYSEDYIDMTDGETFNRPPVEMNYTSPSDLANPPVFGGDMNGSSVYSDVFSDRSSDTVGTQELLNDDDLHLHDPTSNPTPGDDINGVIPPGETRGDSQDEGISAENGGEESDEELGINRGLLNRVLKLDIDCANRRTSLDDINQNDVNVVTSPPPEIQVEDISLQDEVLGEVGVPLEDGQDDDQGGFYEDREFEFLKATPRVKRSTSLKTYKTPPGTPKRKMVRFADALGLDLESVRHILNMEAPPKIPMSATQDLDLKDDDDHFKPASTGTGARYLTACFPQPGSNPSFPRMVQDRIVILESSIINDHSLSVTGTIRVANVSFHKKVVVRYSTNNWLTFNDINAGYVQGSNDGPTDRYSFSISLPHYFSTGSKMEFCIQYIAGGQHYWDNNHGANYVVECFARALHDSDKSWVSFL